MKELIKRELKINAIPIAWLIIRALGSKVITGKFRSFWKAFSVKRLA